MPIVHGLAQEYERQVEVVQLNAAEPEVIDLQAGYGVRGHPSVVVLDGNNQVTDRFFGATTVERLRTALDNVAP